MLAALLLNLPDYLEKDGAASKRRIRWARGGSRAALRSAAEEVLDLLDKPPEGEGATAPVAKEKTLKRGLRKLAKSVERYANADDSTPEDVSRLVSTLQMRIFELRQIPEYVMTPVITELEIMLDVLMQDEEDILILLLAE